MVISFVVLILCYSLLAQSVTPGFAIVLLVGAVVASIVFAVSTYRLGTGNSVGTQVLAARGGAFGDPERGRRRVADRSEIAASRNLRRGRISRLEYERIIAYRHFVHGELSKSEYHQVLEFLDFHQAHTNRQGRAAPHLP